MEFHTPRALQWRQVFKHMLCPSSLSVSHKSYQYLGFWLRLRMLFKAVVV
jgi:hypothetical protein